MLLHSSFSCILVDEVSELPYHLETLLDYLVVYACFEIIQLHEGFSQHAKIPNGNVVDPMQYVTKLEALECQNSADEQLPLFTFVVYRKLIDSSKQLLRCVPVVRVEFGVPFVDLRDLQCGSLSSFVSQIAPLILYFL